MKKIFLMRLIFPLALVAIFGVLFNTSCKKEDKECKAIITAKFLSDTNIVVPFADILIEEGDVYVPGVTDINGQFSWTFPLEAILEVHAYIDTSSFPDSLYYIFEGSTVIRLRPGETIYRSVFVSE